MNQVRWAPGVVSLGECLYAIGGWDGKAALSSVERYCTTGGKWQNVAPMKEARYYAATAGMFLE